MTHFRLALGLLVASLALGQRLELKQARNLGALDAGEAVEGISIRFARSADQQRALDQLLDDLQRPGSSNYHRWLSPEEYADRFGLSDADLARVEKWLRGSGLQIDHRGRTRSYLMVSGTAGRVGRAFGTELRRYEFKGKRHFANAGPVKLPADLSGIVLNVEGLDDFLPEPSQTPEGNLSGGRHVLAPDDYAVIYNVRPALQRGIDGTGQRIAIVGQSRIDLSDMSLFRSRYKLADNVPDVILYPGSRDPGFNDAQGEANLDLQWAGAVARNAKLIYVYGSSAIGAAAHVIDQKLAPIVSVSFSAGCEAQNSQATMASIRNLVQTGNALGITWVNSSGDAGPAGCDSNSSTVVQNG
ncbi:MAG: protease pro-enzyme activation domain-containing protein, partial [Acidobacteria bacterium]|nr:protease pro-enzyme activation domain-containing protein [Acidobacteriota bacterium]